MACVCLKLWLIEDSYQYWNVMLSWFIGLFECVRGIPEHPAYGPGNQDLNQVAWLPAAGTVAIYVWVSVTGSWA